MKLSTTRIERMLEEVEAGLAPPPRPRVRVIINDTDDEAVVKEKKEKALAEYLVRHPEHAGHTIENVQWVLREIVHRRVFAAELAEAAAAAQDEIAEASHGSIDAPSEAAEVLWTPTANLSSPPDPDCSARSKPWRPTRQRGWLTQ